METRPLEAAEPFGVRIRRLRKRLGISPAELAARAGIPPSDLLRVERGEQRLGLDSLARLLAILGAPEGPRQGTATPGRPPRRVR
ncbi:MAG: helix-turn-helix domain-containing protein [Thermoanaerobaculia bacterium]|nr:helix-turn-helix domain-containing protein [Thermoanaerobaculia bacterium]